MKRAHKKKPEEQVKLAKERIRELFKQAKLAFNGHPERSNRYVQMARRIAMKYKIKFTSSQKRQFCKNCGVFLVPGENCRVRSREGKMVYYCLKCKNFMRVPYK